MCNVTFTWLLEKYFCPTGITMHFPLTGQRMWHKLNKLRILFLYLFFSPQNFTDAIQTLFVFENKMSLHYKWCSVSKELANSCSRECAVPGSMCMCVHSMIFGKCTLYFHICIAMSSSVWVCACVSHISGFRGHRVKQSAYHSQEFRDPEHVPLEPKTNFERFLGLRGSNWQITQRLQSDPEQLNTAPGNGCLNIRHVMCVT